MVERARIDPAEVEDVVLGCGLPEGATGIAITPAIRKLMKQHQLAMTDIDLWELHEAYAVTTLYNQAQLETPWDITNVSGGAVALGHPYGMPGIRYLGQTLMELGRRVAPTAVILGREPLIAE